MANVLPHARTILLRRMYARLIIVVGLTLAGMALIAILALLPAYIATSVARAGVSSVESASASEEQVEAARALALIQTLRQFATTTDASSVLLDALARAPEGVAITAIRYNGGDSASFVLSGTSARREGVNRYRDILLADQRFGSVTVPVAALVGTQEGRFSITLSGI